MKKLGLDLGSSSAGWFLREDNEILKFGSVVFESGMVKGTSGYSSPTKDRRETRLKRNPIRSRKYRKQLILKKLSSHDMVPLEISEIKQWSSYSKSRTNNFPNNPKFLKWLSCDFSFADGKNYKNPYELRVKALNEKLTPLELGRVLYHITQRRGFKDIGETNKETEKQIKRRKESGFQNALDKHRTIGEALSREYLDKGIRARDNYPYRDEYEDELFKILSKQGLDLSKNGKNHFKDPFVKDVHKAIIWQQLLKTQKGTIGKCILEPKKRRCALSHPLFEVSRAWQFINTIKYKDDKDDFVSIPQEYRQHLFDTIFLKKDSNFKFEIIRKALDKLFQKKKEYNYPLDEKKKTYETTVAGMPFCKGIIKLLGDEALKDIEKIELYTVSTMHKKYHGYSLLDLWHNVTEFDEVALAQFGLQKLKIPFTERTRKGVTEQISPLLKLKESLPNGYGSLSQNVLRKIILHLKEGHLYNDAVLLANLPDALGSDFKEKKHDVFKLLNESNKIYTNRKTVVTIANALIEKYKGEVDAYNNGEADDLFAHKDFEYLLADSDKKDIVETCIGHFGENRWKNKTNKDVIINEVGIEYQDFFFDTKRTYRKLETLQEIFEEQLSKNNIYLKKPLYHHSKRANLFGEPIKYRDTEIEILPLAQVNSIKNPMFNKAMSVLRKIVNQLLVDGYIDQETEIVVEIARELNDNNKRIAIERYQKQREGKREKIREFLNEYRSKEKPTLQVEESIAQFELWDEQIFEETEDINGKTIKNLDRKEILKENNAIRRYELWMEQKGQCIYTGKMISISQLFSRDTDIEHTIPRFLLPDNTLANQTIAFADYNTKIKGTELPVNLPNYSKSVDGVGTKILPRLENWINQREGYKKAFESRQKPSGSEDENAKNKRIQEKHFFKMHYEYWKDKLERFTATDVTDKWARRQLVDTQNINKYAREFLSSYFNRVSVQKGSNTAAFRKMLGYEEKEDEKDRSKHTHHTIDASVLTYIPINASRRDSLIKKMYHLRDTQNKQLHYTPNKEFDAQAIKRKIEEETLVVNYYKDNIITQTFKKVRKAGKIQYKTDGQGNKIIEQPLMSGGDTIRGSLFKDSFLGKIKDVERFKDGQPIRENGDWKYKKGDDEFVYVKREPIEKITKANLKDIIDPVIAKLVAEQLGNAKIFDYQGNAIRHVRIKKKTGKPVKKRVDYKSEKEYKNYYYSESGSIPYGVMVFRPNSTERILLQTHLYQIAEVFREKRKFDVSLFVEKFYPDYNPYEKQLIKVGQKLIVLQVDAEFEKRKDLDFLNKRLYKITKIDNGCLWLKYHITATGDSDIDNLVKEKKDELLWNYEKQMGLEKVIENENILDFKEKNEDFINRKYKFSSWEDFRMKRILKQVGQEKASEIKSELSKFKKIASSIELEGDTPLLKLNTSESWNFLYEDKDFEISILGGIKFLQ